MNTTSTVTPPGYPTVSALAWTSVVLGIAFPVTTAFVLGASRQSDTALCASRQALNIPGAPALYPMPTVAIVLVWLGVGCALTVLAAGLVRYGRAIMDSTRSIGWGALGLLGVVLLAGNGIMLYAVYHGGLGVVAVCA